MTSEPTREQLIEKWEQKARVYADAVVLERQRGDEMAALANERTAAEARLIASALKDAARLDTLANYLEGEDSAYGTDLRAWVDESDAATRTAEGGADAPR